MINLKVKIMNNSFEDTLPEEREAQYKELTAMLQQAYSKPVSVTPNRQAQILERVRERLEIPDSEESVVSQDSIDIIAPSGVLPLREVPRQHRLSRWVTLIAAVLVIGALVVTDLLIFQARTPSPGTQPTEAQTPSPGMQPTLAPPIGPLGKPVTVHTQANGLEATMQITSGPYFLSELLDIQLSITNHSQDTLWLEPYSEKVCAPSYFRDWFTLTMMGGGKPSDTNLQHNMADLSYPCKSMLGNGPIRTGQVWIFNRYIVLTNSGRITLSAQLGLEKVVRGQNGGNQMLPNSNPLAGHWPSLQISVHTGIPSDRLITGQQRGMQVTIDAPSLAQSHLFYTYVLRCELSLSSGSSLAPLTLQQPQCDSGMQHKNPADRFVKWTYAVGEFGYAMFSGSVHG
jgi:hypothetical protein